MKFKSAVFPLSRQLIIVLVTDNEYRLEIFIGTAPLNFILMLNYSSGTVLLNMLISWWWVAFLPKMWTHRVHYSTDSMTMCPLK